MTAGATPSTAWPSCAGGHPAKPMQTHQGKAKPGHPRAADRDLGQQLKAIADSLAKHPPALEEAPPNTVPDSANVVRPRQCTLYDREALTARKLRAHRADERLVVHEIEKAEKLGVMRSLATAPEAAKLRSLEEDFPHFAEIVDLMRQRCVLARVTPGQTFTLPPLLLSGPPGVGKTAFAEAVAECLGMPFRRVDIASTTAGFALAGLHATWQGAKPGAVWDLLQAPSAANVLMLEEIDKAADSRYPVLGPLYSLLERSSAKHFTDEFMDISVDASNLMWIATCNRPDHLDRALHSRFVEFEIPVPTTEQMAAITRSVYRRMRSTAPWAAAFEPELPDVVIDLLSVATPRELIRLLENAHARAAARRSSRLQPEDFDHEPFRRGGRRIGFM